MLFRLSSLPCVSKAASSVRKIPPKSSSERCSQFSRSWIFKRKEKSRRQYFVVLSRDFSKYLGNPALVNRWDSASLCLCCMCPVILSARIKKRGESLLPSRHCGSRNKGAGLWQSNRIKRCSVLPLQRVGLFLQSVVQLFLSIGWAYWIPILI